MRQEGVVNNFQIRSAQLFALFDECLPNSIQTRYVLTYTSYTFFLLCETLNCNIAPYFNYFFHRDYHNFKINLYKFLLQSLVWIVFRFRHYTLSDFRYYVFTSCIWAFLNLLTYEYVRYIHTCVVKFKAPFFYKEIFLIEF